MKTRKIPDPARRDAVYQWINSFSGKETDDMTKDQTQIAALAEEIYQHRLNLCSRGELDFEDQDIEAIVNLYEKLNRLCGSLMYDQGWLDGTLAARE